MNFLMLEILEREFITLLRSKELKLYSLATPFLFDIQIFILYYVCHAIFH